VANVRDSPTIYQLLKSGPNISTVILSTIQLFQLVMLAIDFQHMQVTSMIT